MGRYWVHSDPTSPSTEEQPVDPRRLAQRVGVLATLHAELAVALRAAGTGGGAGWALGLSLEEEVITAREHAAVWLRSWAAVVVEELGGVVVHGPWAWGLTARPLVDPPPSDHPYVVATWLRRHARWMSGQSWAPECVDNLESVIAEALRARQLVRVRRFTLDLPDGAPALCPSRAEGPQQAARAALPVQQAFLRGRLPRGWEVRGVWLLAPHPLCGGKLVGWVNDADERTGRASTIRCESDPAHEWPSTSWHSLGRKVQPGRLGPVRRLAAAVRA